MYVRVAVSDPLPLFRRGVIDCLSVDGYEAESREDLLRWARAEERRVVLLTLDGPDDWGLLADLCRVPADVLVLVVLDDPSVSTYVRAISAGAAGAIRRDASPAAMREAFEAALNGKVVLPLMVLRALAAPADGPEPGSAEARPTPQEVDWLRQLAQGMTVARLADLVGYSERMMFRLLRDLYDKLDTTGRTEAIMRARDQGWI